MPWYVVAAFSAHLTALEAADELRGAHATAFGAGLAMGGKDAKPELKKHQRRLLRAAFPFE